MAIEKWLKRQTGLSDCVFIEFPDQMKIGLAIDAMLTIAKQTQRAVATEMNGAVIACDQDDTHETLLQRIRDEPFAG